MCPNEDARAGGQKRAEFQKRLEHFDIDEEDRAGMNFEYGAYFYTLENKKLEDFDKEFNNGMNLVCPEANCEPVILKLIIFVRLSVERQPNAIPIAQ